MNMPQTIRLLLVLLPFACAASAQTVQPSQPAYVTFFSPSINLHSIMPGTKNGVYAGKIYDGEHPLAHLRPNRFVTFAVTPGSHTFAANYWLSKTPEGAATVTLDAQPGQHYFLQASIKITASIVEIAFILKEVPCAKAQQPNKNSKPLIATDILPDGAKMSVPETTFPACPAPLPEPTPPTQ